VFALDAFSIADHLVCCFLKNPTMADSDNEAPDPELLALLRQSLGISGRTDNAPADTKVLASARYIYDNAIDVALDMRNTQRAASVIWKKMEEKGYGMSSWSEHALHPMVDRDGIDNNDGWDGGEEDETEMDVDGHDEQAKVEYGDVEGKEVALMEEQTVVQGNFVSVGDEDSGTQPNSSNYMEAEEGDLNETVQNPAIGSHHAADAVVPPTEMPSSLSVSSLPRIPMYAGRVERGKRILAPKAAAHFIFTLDLLNFSFWSTSPSSQRFGVLYNNQVYTGYWSLVAALHRALDDGVPITSPRFWNNPSKFTFEAIKNVFRSATSEEMPLLQERFDIMQEAGAVLIQHFDSEVTNLISQANKSAAALVNLLADRFPCFKDECRFDGRRVRIMKRAQILVADLWAAFGGERLGAFEDVDKITMFAGIFPFPA
jgi:hypothetical protein